MAALWTLLLLSSYPALRLTAQVGHPPDRSPFHDIRLGGSVVLSVGYLGGGRGIVGVGPSNGDLFSLHYERPFGRVLFASFGASAATTTRYVMDPAKDSASRKSGPVDDNLAIVDAGLGMLLAGGKTWHGIAPYWGISVGAAIGKHVAADPSDYNFGVKLEFGPEAGVRWYLGRRVSVRAAARVLFWRLSYPLQFRDASSADSTRILPGNGALTEWTRHPVLNLGVGWTF